LEFHRDGTEDYGVIYDSNKEKIAASDTCWLPERGDDYLDLPTLVYQLRLMTAAPKLLVACRLALAFIEDMMEAEDPKACTQTEWQGEPMRTLRKAIAEAETGFDEADLPY
jgi:hypothetical protein